MQVSAHHMNRDMGCKGTSPCVSPAYPTHSHITPAPNPAASKHSRVVTLTAQHSLDAGASEEEAFHAVHVLQRSLPATGMLSQVAINGHVFGGGSASGMLACRRCFACFVQYGRWPVLPQQDLLHHQAPLKSKLQQAAGGTVPDKENKVRLKQWCSMCTAACLCTDKANFACGEGVVQYSSTPATVTLSLSGPIRSCISMFC